MPSAASAASLSAAATTGFTSRFHSGRAHFGLRRAARVARHDQRRRRRLRARSAAARSRRFPTCRRPGGDPRRSGPRRRARSHRRRRGRPGPSSRRHLPRRSPSRMRTARAWRRPRPGRRRRPRCDGPRACARLPRGCAVGPLHPAVPAAQVRARQRDREARAAARSGRELDLMSAERREPAHDREPEPHAAPAGMVPGRRGQLHELVEDARAVVLARCRCPSRSRRRALRRARRRAPTTTPPAGV